MGSKPKSLIHKKLLIFVLGLQLTDGSKSDDMMNVTHLSVLGWLRRDTCTNIPFVC